MSVLGVPPLFDGFRIERLLGQGAMGRVFAAHDTVLDRPVAIKFIAMQSPDAHARERFMTEARAIARLAHPNIVSIYRVGEVAGQPYLVSELVRGQGLDQRVLPVAWQEAHHIALGIALALVAAHRANVLHRDIKPANVLRAESGEIKLCDFGLAKLIDRETSAPQTAAPIAHQLGDLAATISRITPAFAAPVTSGGRAETGLAGTPLYMSPEQWRGAQVSERSDFYSLGALIFELCTGHPPVVGASTAELRAKVLDAARPSLASQLRPAAAHFAALIDRCLHADAALRFSNASELVEALTALTRTPERLLPAGSPYRGLLSFGADHRAVFFGRTHDVEAIIEMLRTRPFVVITGDSGVGKSSLALAGVLPRIEEGVFADRRTHRVVTMVPGRHPLRALVDALAPHVSLSRSELEATLRTTPGDLARALTTGLTLFVDQLEELRTNSEADEAALVAHALVEIGSCAGGLRVIASARGDFLTRLSALPFLGHELARALFIVRPLAEHELREAIVGPARAKGVELEGAEIVGALLSFAMASPGGLPLLQFALAELWERRDVSGHRITRQALDDIGGVEGALARHAESVFQTMTNGQQRTTRLLLTHLASAQRTRQRRSELELIRVGGADASVALTALVRGRLLVTTQDEREDTEYAIAHEALLDHWPRLRAWLQEDVETEALKHRLFLAANEWYRLERSLEALWAGRALEAFELAALEPSTLSSREHEFIVASKRSRAATRRRRLLTRVGIPLVVVLTWAGLTWQAQRALNARVDARLAEGRALHTRALASHEETEASRALAFAAFDAFRPEAAEHEWDRALSLAARTNQLYAEASRMAESAFMLDGARADVRRLLGTILFERAANAEIEHRPDQASEFVERMKGFDETGALMRRWAAPATVDFTTQPPNAQITKRAVLIADARRTLGAIESLGSTPLLAAPIEPGSMVFELSVEGRDPVVVPFVARRGETTRIEVQLPERAPRADLVFIPPGRFLFGSIDSEEARRTHLLAQPQHEVVTRAYWVGRHEVTFGEYLESLDELPAAEREARRPKLAQVHGALDVTRSANGQWRIRLQPTDRRYEAGAGELIRFDDRPEAAASHDWLRMPVTGITWEDAQVYLAWLDKTGRLRGARLCTEHEWERAARGADNRLYPTGDTLAPTDANYDETYGRKPSAFGPDHVGAHPTGDSVFKVADLAGNVWEWVSSRNAADEICYRGGSWYESRMNARSNNRQVGERSQRDLVIGFRVCASFDNASAEKGTP